MKKVMFYCQHILGMGHFIRSMEIVRRLRDFDVCFLNGGEIIQGFDFPHNVRVVNLPAIKSDEVFRDIQVTKGGETLDEVKTRRTREILSAFDQFNPDLVMIELFPFGRKKFAFELVPLLERIRLRRKRAKVVCSLRDILVSKSDQNRYEERVCDLINRYFDLVLIHADPQFQKLEETFSRANDLKVEIKYTGYVAQSPSTHPVDISDFGLPSAETNRPFILASIGGGRVGKELLQCAIEASSVLEEILPHRMLIFTGPYLPDEEFLQLQEMAKDRPYVTLQRYTPHLLPYMKKADLSISMAGYNTCMNILTTGVRAIVLPFTGGKNNEQTIRAEKLEALRVVTVIRPCELKPNFLAEKITQCLKKVPISSPLNICGVENTFAALTETLKKGNSVNQSIGESVSLPKKGAMFQVLEMELRPHLEQLQVEKRGIDIFLRDDDIDEDEETLRQLIDISLANSIPLNLQIIPHHLTASTIRLLKQQKKFHPTLLELNQHGWQHLNHEKEGKKCEFGFSRTFEQKFEDISRGKTLLEEVFEDKFYPVFTPPWNRCAEDTFKVIDRLGFKVFSKDKGGQPVTGFRFREISTTLDLYRWKGGPVMRSQEEIVRQLVFQIENLRVIGILLHHKVMNQKAFNFLDILLCVLRKYSNIRFHTFQSMVESVEPEPAAVRIQ